MSTAVPIAPLSPVSADSGLLTAVARGTRSHRRRLLSVLVAASLTAGVAGLALILPWTGARTHPGLVLGVTTVWFLFAVLARAFEIRRGERRRTPPLLTVGLGGVALLGIASAVVQVPVYLDLVVLLAVLTTVHALARPLVRRLLDLLAPPRVVVVCPASEVVHHQHSGARRVRGFSAEALADSDVVVGAVRLDITRGIDRVELRPGVPAATVDQLAWALRQDGVDLLLHQSSGQVRASRTDLLMTAEGPGLLLRPPRPGAFARFVKRSTDLAGASVLLLLFSPLLLLTALAIRREDGGPALFRQERIGLDGEPFEIVKFRTMVMNADDQLARLLREQNADGTPLFKVEKDPRVTKLGAFLRRSSIDELPQLLNVLQGDMSLVGPRPQRAQEVALYDGTAGHRLGVRPGMTGLWQVSGRSRLSWEQARDLDVYYAHNWTPALDGAILARTVKAVVTSDGAV